MRNPNASLLRDWANWKQPGACAVVSRGDAGLFRVVGPESNRFEIRKGKKVFRSFGHWASATRSFYEGEWL